MPQDELWVKLGGDKGRGSFKVNLQLCNVQHPNSQKCTSLISMCMASDSVANLHTCLDMYAEQVKEIEGMELRLDVLRYTDNSQHFTVHAVDVEFQFFSPEITSSYAVCMACQGPLVCDVFN